MIYFIKVPDKDNQFDLTKVQISIENEVTLDDLFNMFKEFTKALGFVGVEKYFNDEGEDLD